MNTVEIKCDGCGTDLAYTRNDVDYRLILQSERKPIHPEAKTVTSLTIHPPMEQARYFCGLLCLDRWRTARPSW